MAAQPESLMEPADIGGAAVGAKREIFDPFVVLSVLDLFFLRR